MGTNFADVALGQSLRDCFVRLSSKKFLSAVTKAMNEVLEKLEGELDSVDVYEIDQGVFENILKAGGSEIDVIARICLSRQRAEVEKSMPASLKSMTQIQRLRKLRMMSPPLSRGISNNLLRDWRRDEIMMAGSSLNPLFAPLRCGDLFQTGNAKATYMLLSQPCDIALRMDGTRKFSEGVLVRARPANIAKDHDSANRHRFFALPSLAGDFDWELDFNEWGSVSLDCLDLSSFNKDGVLKISPDIELPEWVLPGVAKRFAKLLTKFCSDGAPKRLLSLSDTIKFREPKPNSKTTDKTVRFDYSRYGWVREPWATSALSAFCSFQARAAYEVDYTKGLIPTEPSAETESISAETIVVAKQSGQ